ncbi:type IV pilin N-terminal domain-containing protein [Haloarcula halophila]|uniref:type IV pilin N-terminal domain-containing protein n=1 Tax=Haloarcula TaxID=2237 RepID=UPI0023E3A21A|nr:type IV pilin N-terminal domain-containing protein [Halomicroarcula sp. DFY41]
MGGRSRGASSVIGVLLLVGVTVIVAGLLSVFALQIGDSATRSAPTAEFEVDTCTDCGSLALADDPSRSGTTNFLNITFTHGETLDAENVAVYLEGQILFDPSKTGSAAYYQPANYDGAASNDLRWSSDQIAAGEQLILEDDADASATEPVFREGQVVRVVWTQPDTGESYTLVKRTLRY